MSIVSSKTYLRYALPSCRTVCLLLVRVPSLQSLGARCNLEKLKYQRLSARQESLGRQRRAYGISNIRQSEDTRDAVEKPSSPTDSASAWLRARRFRATVLSVGASCLLVLGTTVWYESSSKNSAESSESGVLSPTTFHRCQLASKTDGFGPSSIYSVKFDDPPAKAVDHRLWEQGIWSVSIKQPQLQIEREYTPLPPLDSAEDHGVLRFFLKHEPHGEVSGYLRALREGATVDVRGPYVKLSIPEKVDEVVFVAGGTGVATALQAAYALSRRKRQSGGLSERGPRMTLLWASRTREAAMGSSSDASDHIGTETSPASQLSQIGESSRSQNGLELEMEFFFDQDGTFIKQRDIAAAMGQGGRGFSDYVRGAVGSLWGVESKHREGKGKRLVLVCGSDGFVECIAGPKVSKNGLESQGKISGMLSKCDLDGWQVWKL